MKRVEAIVRHIVLDDVLEAMDGLGIHGMTVTEVKGFGKQKGYTETYRGSQVTIRLRPKLKLEMVVGDQDVDRVVEAIRSVAHTGEIGDGKIFVSDMGSALAIRTGLTGDGAL